MQDKKILELKESPIFNLSLSSKELFHSNLLAWIAEDKETCNLFVSILRLFGLEENLAKQYAEGIRNGKYAVQREYNNFDFCICEYQETPSSSNQNKTKTLGKIVLILENKFKSIPNEQQLKKYQEKVSSINEAVAKSDPRCHFVLLSLSETKHGIRSVLTDAKKCASSNQLGDIEWKFVTYKDYAKLITETVKSKSNYKELLLSDYAHYIEIICEYLEKELPANILAEKWVSILSPRPELIDIRMNDVWQKLIVNDIATHLCKELKWNCEFGIDAENFINECVNLGKVNVGTGFTRGTGLIEAKIKIEDNCLFGIQIQNGYYKRLLETTKKRSPKTTFESVLNRIDGIFCANGKIWQNPDNLNIFNPDDLIYPIRHRKGKILDGFGGYGTTFICQSKKIASDTSVEDVLKSIINDINKVASKLGIPTT